MISSWFSLVPMTLGLIIGDSIVDKLKAQFEANTQNVFAERTAPVHESIVDLSVNIARNGADRTSCKSCCVQAVGGKNVYDKSRLCRPSGLLPNPDGNGRTADFPA